MDLGIVTGFVSKIFEPLAGLIDDLTLSKEEKAQFKEKLQQMQLTAYTQAMSLEKSLVEAQASVIKAEAAGESWMQRNWRPTLMLTIVAVIANNYVFFPYLQAFGVEQAMILELPDELFTLMTVGVGGYIGSRGIEKVAKTRALTSLMENGRPPKE